ncbi:hypothetical protein N7495_003054 [Penicillium taxi]|uniref:uncharacterized protein n=1 Tax=Penicillium taxi TaxID=168475 RepID=UPI002545B18D|nr:uncharacterized protein N7495_003054 [Penicillium taxi]KAJ5902526.1 hypothetical protein N7495_003054 [Penicillium taxi]
MESDNGRPRTNYIRTGKRAPEAVRSPKTGGRWVTLQRQPNRLPQTHPICLVKISPLPSHFIIKLRSQESA